MFHFVEFSGKYHGKCLPILYAYLNGCHLLEHPKRKHHIKPNAYSQIPDEPFCKVSAQPVKAYGRTFLNFLKVIFSQLFHSSCDLHLKHRCRLDEDQADLTTRFC